MNQQFVQLVVVYNPGAGASDWTAARVEALLRAAGHAPQMVSSQDNWRAQLSAQPDAFVAAGGDGTVHQVVLELKDRDVPIAILPLGTANNVACALGYRPADDLGERVAGWREREQLLQLAAVQINGREQFFLESVGVGAFANMMHESEKGEKSSAPAVALLGIRKRLVELLLEARPIQVTATFDGRTVTGEYLLLECLNLPWYGPRLELAPAQSPESGTLTLCGVPVHARELAAQWISTGMGEVAELMLGRGQCVEICADDRAHIDGAPWPDDGAGNSRLRVRGGQQRVRVWV